MNLRSGMRLGPYEILAPLGAGGMGEVYRVRDTPLDLRESVDVPAGRNGATTSEYPVKISCATIQRRSFKNHVGGSCTCAAVAVRRLNDHQAMWRKRLISAMSRTPDANGSVTAASRSRGGGWR